MAGTNSNRGTSKSVHTSLYDHHLNIIHEYKEKMGFTKDAQALQSIITYFDRNHGKSFLKNVLVFVVFPMVITTILSMTASTIFKIQTEMANEGLAFEGLHKLGTFFQMMGLASFAFLATSIILFIYIVKKRGF